MFGYIITNAETLPKERQERFRQFYCGLCRQLRVRFGLIGTAALSFDLTFAAMLLNALYEPGESGGRERCLPHPMKRHGYVTSPALDYAADMNIALAYYKCLDDWQDDRNLLASGEAALLKKGYADVRSRYPEQCFAIEAWIKEIHRIEASGKMEIDPPVNATGRMLGALFDYRSGDIWSGTLREIGDGLGRYVYFMDAYDDLDADIRRNRYNPLKPFKDREDYEAMCLSALTMMVADATQAFELLPIVQDADILRNILYSGIWSKYAMLQKKRGHKEKERYDAGSL